MLNEGISLLSSSVVFLLLDLFLILSGQVSAAPTPVWPLESDISRTSRDLQQSVSEPGGSSQSSFAFTLPGRVELPSLPQRRSVPLFASPYGNTGAVIPDGGVHQMAAHYKHDPRQCYQQANQQYSNVAPAFFHPLEWIPLTSFVHHQMLPSHQKDFASSSSRDQASDHDTREVQEGLQKLSIDPSDQEKGNRAVCYRQQAISIFDGTSRIYPQAESSIQPLEGPKYGKTESQKAARRASSKLHRNKRKEFADSLKVPLATVKSLREVKKFMDGPNVTREAWLEKMAPKMARQKTQWSLNYQNKMKRYPDFNHKRWVKDKETKSIEYHDKRRKKMREYYHNTKAKHAGTSHGQKGPATLVEGNEYGHSGDLSTGEDGRFSEIAAPASQDGELVLLRHQDMHNPAQIGLCPLPPDLPLHFPLPEYHSQYGPIPPYKFPPQP